MAGLRLQKGNSVDAAVTGNAMTPAELARHSTPAPDKDRVASWRTILAPELPPLCKERAYVRCSFLLRGVTD
jgi:hypothetical protein